MVPSPGLLGPHAVLSAFALPGGGNLLSCKCFSCFEAKQNREPFCSYSLVALSPAILCIESDLFNGCLPLLPLVHQLGEPRRQGCVGCYTQGLVLYPGLCGMCLLHALLEHPQAQSEAALTMKMLQEIHSGDFSLLLSQSLLLQFYNS